MGLLDRMAAALAWLGRQGTTAVAISILLGIFLPPLGALVRKPYSSCCVSRFSGSIPAPCVRSWSGRSF